MVVASSFPDASSLSPGCCSIPSLACVGSMHVAFSFTAKALLRQVNTIGNQAGVAGTFRESQGNFEGPKGTQT
jgi:hypothetical protein